MTIYQQIKCKCCGKGKAEVERDTDENPPQTFHLDSLKECDCDGTD